MAADKELATQASKALVAAASSPGWAEVQGDLSQLLGRYDQNPERVARWVTQLHQEASSAVPPYRTRALRDLEVAWATRLTDLLEEHPEASADLVSLMAPIQISSLSPGALPERETSPGRGQTIADALDAVIAARDPHRAMVEGEGVSPGPGDPDLDL